MASLGTRTRYCMIMLRRYRILKLRVIQLSGHKGIEQVLLFVLVNLANNNYFAHIVSYC